jgi:hypothetical protein
MDPTALYYALSTIAQCAAALAALIGFLGLWRLDRLREEYGQAERDVGWLLGPTGGKLRYDLISPSEPWDDFRFTILHWHFCARMSRPSVDRPPI